MPITNISNIVFDQGKPGMDRLTAWLQENVGGWYPVNCEDPVVRVGDGWEIRSERWHTDEGIASRWILDITDEKKFVLYCMRWAS